VGQLGELAQSRQQVHSFTILNAPASHIQGAAAGTVTWCLTADGAFEESPSGPLFSGSWFQYTDTHAIIRLEQGTRSNYEVMAVAKPKVGATTNNPNASNGS
jgi:hypothetical protein